MRKLIAKDHQIEVAEPLQNCGYKVLSDFAASIPVTPREVEAIDAFLADELDRLLAKSESCAFEAMSEEAADGFQGIV